jgi:ABC-type dipeptide/oligopeptide/nickel transport systems, permease components
MMLLILGGAIFAPWISSYDPYYQDFAAALEPPSLRHLFGTDSLGRDIFTRVLYGGRIDLQIGVITTYVPMVYGVLLGPSPAISAGASMRWSCASSMSPWPFPSWC